MDRIQLMQLVRAYQVGGVDRREFMVKATATLGSLAAANTLLAACAAFPNENPPPVVAEVGETAVPRTTTTNGLTTGIVTYPGADNTELMGFLAYETGAAARPGVIVVQEWWGLNDHIKDVAQRFAQAGFVALAPDLYHGVVTTEPDEARKQAMELGMRDAVGEIMQAVAHLKAQPFVGGGIGIVGFCMGGGLVYQSVAAGDALAAGVGFYGSPLQADAAQNVTAPVLSFLGTADRIPVGGVQAMHDVLAANGVENKFQIYEGAQHAFFNDTRAGYSEEAATDAWTQMLAWSLSVWSSHAVSTRPSPPRAEDRVFTKINGVLKGGGLLIQIYKLTMKVACSTM